MEVAPPSREQTSYGGSSLSKPLVVERASLASPVPFCWVRFPASPCTGVGCSPRMAVQKPQVSRWNGRSQQRPLGELGYRLSPYSGRSPWKASPTLCQAPRGALRSQARSPCNLSWDFQPLSPRSRLLHPSRSGFLSHRPLVCPSA